MPSIRLELFDFTIEMKNKMIFSVFPFLSRVHRTFIQNI